MNDFRRSVTASMVASAKRHKSRKSRNTFCGFCAFLRPLDLSAQHCSVSNALSPGARFRAALAAERPLQIAGAINAYAALLAQRAGFRAIYLSGAGVAN